MPDWRWRRASALGVIAEGVEAQAQRDFLSASGCHDYQGYFFSRPLPLEGFEQFIAAQENCGRNHGLHLVSATAQKDFK